MIQHLPAGILDAAVEEVNLRPGFLSDQLGEEGSLLIFLRHFG